MLSMMNIQMIARDGLDAANVVSVVHDRRLRKRRSVLAKFRYLPQLTLSTRKLKVTILYLSMVDLEK